VNKLEPTGSLVAEVISIPEEDLLFPELYVSYDSAQKLKMEAADLPLGPDAAPDLRPRTADERRFNPLKGFWARPITKASSTRCGWPMARSGRCRSRWTCPRPSPKRVEIGQDIALRDAEGVILAILSVTDKWTPEQGARGGEGLRRRRHRASGGDYLHHRRARSISAARSPASSRRRITISAPAATRRTSCAPISASSAGAAWWPSRPATRCTARTRN
jgi:hypothetical protein